MLIAALFGVVLMWLRETGYWHKVHHLSEERGLAIELRMTLTMLFTLAAIAVSMGVSVMLAGFALGWQWPRCTNLTGWRIRPSRSLRAFSSRYFSSGSAVPSISIV